MRLLAAMAVAAGCAAAAQASAATRPVGSDPIPVITLKIAAFAADAKAGDDSLAPLMNRLSYVSGQGPTVWTQGMVPLDAGRGRAVDSIRVSVGGVLQAPGGAALNLRRAQFEARDYEVSLIRDWPAALKFDAGAVAVDVTPHAGLGLTNIGGLAEAGATVRLSAASRAQRAARELARLGVGDGAAFGDRGRWYLFIAASGRAVGLNVLRDDNGWNRAGWTTDASSALVGDAQVGVGWRRGSWQTSVGYVHREVKGAHMIWGQQTKEDSLAAFTLSFKPH
ncbi:lipid A-modifier LpxR family protein [Phenylobacterium sp.]|uniref:lipid A-modifier LpxR family protein n=1 Tax=Phenylobacterium sp. TaxID=1871053 RepID=UPI002F402E49